MRTRSGPAPPPICVNTVLAKLPKGMAMGWISAAVWLWLNFPTQAFRRSPRPASLNVTAAKLSRALSCARSTRWPASSAAATATPLPLRIRRRDGMLRECTGGGLLGHRNAHGMHSMSWYFRKTTGVSTRFIRAASARWSQGGKRKKGGRWPGLHRHTGAGWRCSTPGMSRMIVILSMPESMLCQGFSGNYGKESLPIIVSPRIPSLQVLRAGQSTGSQRDQRNGDQASRDRPTRRRRAGCRGCKR